MSIACNLLPKLEFAKIALMVEQSPSQRDPFRPPTISVMVHCIHCHQEFDSYLIHWIEEEFEGLKQGFWCCPNPGCDGKGFGFDIFPVDPEYRDEDGQLMWCDDDEGEEGEFADDEDYDEYDAAVDDNEDWSKSRLPETPVDEEELLW